MWTLKSLTVSGSDRRPIASVWFDGQTESVQNAFLARMRFLVALSGHGWDRPYVGQLHRECKGLFEIVLKVDNVQHRPIGYFSGKEEFTFLFFATERDHKLDPPGTCKLAQAAKDIAISHKERVCEITIE
jgi:hypothetical protein